MRLNLPAVKLIATVLFSIIKIIKPGIIKASDINGSMTFDGKTRTYLLHIPSGYDAAHATPLLFVFHGLCTTGSLMADITGFSPIADQENFIVVYPDGLNKRWATPNKSPDDVGFISALIDLLSTDYNIDAKHIFATGASNGGMFAYRLGLELADRIAAVAAVAGYMPSYLSSAPTPSRPVSVLLFHGTSDPIIPYSEAESAASDWIDFDNCSSSPVTVQMPDTDPTDGTTVDQMTYADGTSSSEVVFYKIYNGGHTWPGADSHGMLGKVCKDINASEIIWDFFKDHSMNSAPAVSITSPPLSYNFIAPASIMIRATASDPDGTVKQVQFYNAMNSLKVDTTVEYTYSWKNVLAGTYNIIVVATDNNGATSSDSLTITVNPQKTPFNGAEDNFIETHYDLANQQFIITKIGDISEYDLSMYDSFGRTVLSLQNIRESKKVISAGSFGQGIYTYRVKNKNSGSMIGKFIVIR